MNNTYTYIYTSRNSVHWSRISWFAMIFSFIFVFTLATSEIFADWTSWRGENGSGISHDNNWDPSRVTESTTPLWEVNVGKGWSAVASIDGLVYTMGNTDGKDVVYCLKAEDGSTLWQYGYEQEDGNFPGPRATPVVDGNRLYTISRDGLTFCFDRLSGKVCWSRNLKNEYELSIHHFGISGSPVVSDNLLILNVGKFGAVLDKTSGEDIWCSSPDESGYATPVLYEQDGKKRMIVAGTDYFYGVDVLSGAELWAHEYVNRWKILAADPIFIAGNVFISSQFGPGSTLLDLSAETPGALWNKKDIQIYWGSPVYLDGYIYGCDGEEEKEKDCKLLCVDAKTGDVVWSANKGFVSFIIVDRKIVAIGQDGILTIAEATPEAYRELVRTRVIETSRKGPVWTAPVFDNGLLFVRNGLGDLVCLDLRKSS